MAQIETLYEENTRHLKVAAQKAADAEREAKRLSDLLHALCKASHEREVLPTRAQMREASRMIREVADLMDDADRACARVEEE